MTKEFLAGVVVAAMITAPAAAQTDPYAADVRHTLEARYQKVADGFQSVVGLAALAVDCRAISETQRSMIISHEMTGLTNAWVATVPYGARPAPDLKSRVYAATSTGDQIFHRVGCATFHDNPGMLTSLREYGDCQGPACFYRFGGGD